MLLRSAPFQVLIIPNVEAKMVTQQVEAPQQIETPHQIEEAVLLDDCLTPQEARELEDAPTITIPHLAENTTGLSSTQRLMLAAFDLVEGKTANEAAFQCCGLNGGKQDTYRKRAKELLDKGVLRTAGVRKCTITNKPAMTFVVKAQS